MCVCAVDDYLDLHQELDEQEHDVYGKIAHTLPFLKIPNSLTLTSDNFAERIKEHDRTVVMFYMQCKSRKGGRRGGEGG